MHPVYVLDGLEEVLEVVVLPQVPVRFVAVKRVKNYYLAWAARDAADRCGEAAITRECLKEMELLRPAADNTGCSSPHLRVTCRSFRRMRECTSAQIGD